MNKMTRKDLEKQTTENEYSKGIYTEFTEINEIIKKERGKRRICNVLSVLSFYLGFVGFIATPIILSLLYFGDDTETEWSNDDTQMILIFLIIGIGVFLMIIIPFAMLAAKYEKRVKEAEEERDRIRKKK